MFTAPALRMLFALRQGPVCVSEGKYTCATAVGLRKRGYVTMDCIAGIPPARLRVAITQAGLAALSEAERDQWANRATQD